MADKPFQEMTDDELRQEQTTWEKYVETAAGWSSAYFAAKTLKSVCAEGNRRGLNFENKFPITVGAQ